MGCVAQSRLQFNKLTDLTYLEITEADNWYQIWYSTTMRLNKHKLSLMGKKTKNWGNKIVLFLTCHHDYKCACLWIITNKSAATKEANGKQTWAHIQLGSPAGKMADGSLWREVCVDAWRAWKRIWNENWRKIGFVHAVFVPPVCGLKADNFRDFTVPSFYHSIWKRWWLSVRAVNLITTIC